MTKGTDILNLAGNDALYCLDYAAWARC